MQHVYTQDPVWAIAAHHLPMAVNALESATMSEQALAMAEASIAPIQAVGNYALIALTGPMLKNAGFLEYFGFASMRKVASAIDVAAADDKVDGIVLVINSPGGSVNGTQELAHAVAMAKQKKPVIVQVDGMAASAAYYVAAQASEIRMHPDDTVGSIGVFNVLYDASKMYEDMGVKTHVLTTGKNKGTGVPGAPITESQIALYQGLVDEYFKQFKTAVQQGRGMAPAALEKLADGSIYLAADAVGHGLADKVMTLKETLAELTTEKSRTKKNGGYRSDTVGKHTSTARARLALLQAM